MKMKMKTSEDEEDDDASGDDVWVPEEILDERWLYELQKCPAPTLFI